MVKFNPGNFELRYKYPGVPLVERNPRSPRLQLNMVRIGVDVGGTGIQIGVVNEQYRIIQESSIPTRTDLPFEEQVRRIADAVIDTVTAAGLTAGQIESVGDIV